MKISWDRIGHFTLWALQVFLAILFLYSGTDKWRIHAIFWVGLFERIGIGQWFRYFTGSLEIICAILLLIPRTCAIAATLLSFIMVGAVLVHLFILHDGYASFFPAFTLALLVIVAWKRRGAGSGIL